MFWKRFYNLCLRSGKRPNPIGREIGLSSGIISKWKNGGIPNGATLMKLASYFDVSIDYLLGLSPFIKINGELVAMERSDFELRDQILANIDLLNNEGLSHVASYTQDLVDSHRYEYQSGDIDRFAYPDSETSADAKGGSDAESTSESSEPDIYDPEPQD